MDSGQAITTRRNTERPVMQKPQELEESAKGLGKQPVKELRHQLEINDGLEWRPQ
jgi:hypothetical protein